MFGLNIEPEQYFADMKERHWQRNMSESVPQENDTLTRSRDCISQTAAWERRFKSACAYMQGKAREVLERVLAPVSHSRSVKSRASRAIPQNLFEQGFDGMLSRVHLVRMVNGKGSSSTKNSWAVSSYVQLYILHRHHGQLSQHRSNK